MPKFKSKLTYVRNRKTGERIGYSLEPREAVIAAYAQEQKDWSTWFYERKYGKLAALTDGLWECGDWEQELKQ